jgi:hypothetical protein
VDEAAFWSLIESCRVEAGGSGGRLARALEHRLRTLSGPEILRFDEIWSDQFHKLYAWPVWDAGVVMLGWFGDDSFRDFRAWIVSHGADAVARIVGDPDNLDDLWWDRENAFDESFDALSDSAYVAAVGHEPPSGRPSGLLDPAGARLDLSDDAVVRERFPRLAARRAARPPKARSATPKVDADPVERCPNCGHALTLHSVNRAQVTEDGPRQRQYRRCLGCGEITERALGAEGWGPWAIAEVGSMDPGLAFLASRLPASAPDTSEASE